MSKQATPRELSNTPRARKMREARAALKAAQQAPAIEAPAETPVDSTPAESTPAQAPATPAESLKFHIANGFRPKAGHALFSHTLAFLELSGMMRGAAVSGSIVRRALGETAVRYHADKFIDTPNGLTLAPHGAGFFGAAGRASAEMTKVFRSIMATGQPAEGWKLSGLPGAIKPLGAAIEVNETDKQG